MDGSDTCKTALVDLVGSDRTNCKACSTCDAGFHETEACSATSDTVCEVNPPSGGEITLTNVDECDGLADDILCADGKGLCSSGVCTLPVACGTPSGHGCSTLCHVEVKSDGTGTPSKCKYVKAAQNSYAVNAYVCSNVEAACKTGSKNNNNNCDCSPRTTRRMLK